MEPEASLSQSQPDLSKISVITRGISPELLLSQVKNTAPFIWSGAFEGLVGKQYEYLDNLQGWNGEDLDHESYFALCLSAHHATVATFVPTDVDNQIRFKLWSPRLPIETRKKMAERVLASRTWDTTPLSTRWIRGPESGTLLSGHQGEWFSTAAAAYGAFRKKDSEFAAELAQVISREVLSHLGVLKECVQSGVGVTILKASTLIAHNLGDLDRVLDQWGVVEGDPLWDCVYQSGHRSTPLVGDWLKKAGDLNKRCMADENHRHFALRAVRPLRRSADLLLPIGPFFDDWGGKVAIHPALSREEVGQVVEALMSGWERLGGLPGYARALAGIETRFEGGLSRLCSYLPAKQARALRSGGLRSQIAVSQQRFEEQWSRVALSFFR